ncbi:uncharacterized protein LOC141603964 [Silene latifolia]|uniref:uncharacterized protein LOC141603964 n=1 Tax=Silene latifolia TaxID=37657 RepID=UPI003D78492F
MMLRSSSTPILGSLLSSYSESPNHHHNHHHHHHPEFNSPKHVPNKLFFHHAQAGHLHLTSPSSHLFYSSPCVNSEIISTDRDSGLKSGFRRAQSEGNLEGLLSDSCNSFDEFNHPNLTKKFPRKPSCAVLQSIPSFSVYNPNRKYEEGEEEEEEQESGEESEEEMIKAESGNYEGTSMNVQSEDLSMAFINNMWLQDINVVVEQNDGATTKMHLAKGLGAMSGGFNGSGGGYKEHKTREFGGEGGDEVSMEEYYKKMVEENPGSSLFLRNYAQFLHQTKKDLRGAEEYYSRAILMDPGDGEILSKYAQVTWELHGDEDRAVTYFDRAVQASPEDSHILAAYAGFLWETEDAEDDLCTLPPLLHDTAIAAAF